MIEEVEKSLPENYTDLPVITVKIPDEKSAVRPYLLGLKQALVISENDLDAPGAVYASKDHNQVPLTSYKVVAIRYQTNTDDENPVYAENCSIARLDNKPAEKDEAGNAIIHVHTIGYGAIKDIKEIEYFRGEDDYTYLGAEVKVLSRDLRSFKTIEKAELGSYRDLFEGLKLEFTTLSELYDDLIEKKSSILPSNIDQIDDALKEAHKNLNSGNPDPIYYANLLISIFTPFGEEGIKDVIEKYIGNSVNTLKHLYDAIALIEKYAVKMVQDSIRTQTKIEMEVRAEVQQMQKTALLNQQKALLQIQMAAINHELGIFDDEVDELRERLNSPEVQENYPDHVLEECVKIIAAIEANPGHSGSDRRRLRILVQDFPFYFEAQDRPELDEAREILDEDHFGLDEPKERFIEQLAVDIKRGGYAGKPILLVGPPGIGKTTIGKSLAKAMGRPLAYIACGGLSDPSALRGFEPTYIGSREGRIINAIVASGSSEPVLFFDEVDKMGSSNKGNAEDVLMAVIDPAQNEEFVDDFLKVGVNLSDCKAIFTANDLSKVSPILRDRCEIIHLKGYTIEEKMEIGKRHLVPRMMESAGLDEKEFSVPDATLKDIIEKYTNEPGVRRLEAIIRRLTEITVKKVLQKELKEVVVTPELLAQKDWLGPAKDSRERISPEPVVGEVNGMYWSQNGGGILKVQVVSHQGKGRLIATGNLKDSMKESPVYVMAGIKANLEAKIKADLSDKTEIVKKLHESDFTVHVPDAATPKDGPSAGVTITTAITSEVLGLPVNNFVAMTGEVDIKGNVRAIGGLDQKLKGALEAGATTIIVPKANEDDLKKVPLYVRQSLEIYVASHIDEVLLIAIPDVQTKLNITRDKPKLYVIPEDEIKAAANDNKKKPREKKKALTADFTAMTGSPAAVVAQTAPKRVMKRMAGFSPRPA